MRYVVAIFTFLASISCHATTALQVGANELQSASHTGKQIIVRVDVARTVQEHCGNWRWGAEAECPKLAVADVQVFVGKEVLFVPRSAFVDLGSPHHLSVSPTKAGFEIVIQGGDAATSYNARLRFSIGQIWSRRVESGEFPKSAWEETKFSFTR